MRIALVALAACYTGSPAPTASPRVPEPIAIAVHAPAGGEIELVSANALADGGLVVVTNAYPACGQKLRQVRIERYDAAGSVLWTRCVPKDSWSQAVAAADDSGIWIAQSVEASAPAHAHGDDRDLVTARHVTLDGHVGEPRTIAIYHGKPGADPNMISTMARNSVENLRLGGAAIANGELLVAGETKEGAIVDGIWQTEADGISMEGIVLAVPRAGPVRAIAASAGALFQDVAVAGTRFVAAGWCSRSSDTHGPELFPCPNALTAFAVTGEVGGTPQVHVIGQEVYDGKVAIDADGTIAYGASVWHRSVAIDGTTVGSHCARFAFVASWTPTGALRFARSLGDCVQPHASPYARDGVASSEADDNISEHLADVANVAFVDHRPVVTVTFEETNNLPWPLRFDGIAVASPFGAAGAVLTLDDHAHVIAHRVLRVDGRPDNAEQPDTSLARRAGVGRVAVARRWLAVQHGGSLTIDRKRFALGSKLPDPDDMLRGRHAPDCDGAALRSPPDVDAMIADIRDGGGEPEDFACRRAVVAEVGIDIVPF